MLPVGRDELKDTPPVATHLLNSNSGLFSVPADAILILDKRPFLLSSLPIAAD